MQPFAFPPVSYNGYGAVGFHPSHLATVPFAHNQPTLKVEGQAIGAAAVFADDLWLSAGYQAIDKVAAVVDE